MTLVNRRADRSFLDEREPAKLAWLAIEPLWNSIVVANDPTPLDAQMSTLTRGQRALFAIHWCISEVASGGFDQFFTNQAGGLGPEAREGCVLVGNEVFASILDQVMALFPDERPASPRSERLLQLRMMRGPNQPRVAGFEPYDNVFLGMLEELEADMAAYVIEHPEEFVQPIAPAS